MAKHSPAQTTEWVAGRLREADDVTRVDVVSDQVILVSRKKYDPFVAGVVSAYRVEEATIAHLVASDHELEIIANVPKESFWTGGALTLAKEHHIATGTFGDLLRVIGLGDVRSFLPSEAQFVERGLRQHDRIERFERVHDRLYQITRRGDLPDLTVVMLNEYELTVDHIRVARDRYGPFSMVVITNPNGRPTKMALNTADALGVEVFSWGAFYGRLNSK